MQIYNSQKMNKKIYQLNLNVKYAMKHLKMINKIKKLNI